MDGVKHGLDSPDSGRISAESGDVEFGEGFMIETATLKTIVMVLFGLTILWLVKILVKQEFETLVRALVVAVLLGGAFLFLQTTKLERISWKTIRNQVLPPKDIPLVYTIDEKSRLGEGYVRYIFEEPGPKINVVMDANGKKFQIKDIEPVNRVLEALGLPHVTSGAQEQVSITGKLSDANIYRWEGYPRGLLVLELALCQNKVGLERYHCVAAITIRNRS